MSVGAPSARQSGDPDAGGKGRPPVSLLRAHSEMNPEKNSGLEGAKPVYLATAGKFHAFSLASEYARRGRLGRLFSAYHTLKPPPHVPLRRFANHLPLALWQDFGVRIPGTRFTIERKAEVFDRWLERRLRDVPGAIFHGWNWHVSRTLHSLRGKGWLRCVERSCPDNMYQHRILLEESKRTGVPYHYDEALLRQQHEELYEADVIVAPSSYSLNSYSDPVLQKKVRVNSLGANLELVDVPRRSPDPLRVLCVGNDFLRKGICDLGEAFARVPDRNAELWIRGCVPPEYSGKIKDARIQILPAVTRSRLQELYRWANVFCLPSVDEGFGMVVLEALAFGLPVVVTEHVGCRDVLDERVAITVPIRDSRALAEAVQRARSLVGDGFEAARREILARTTWAACAERMLGEVYG